MRVRTHTYTVLMSKLLLSVHFSISCSTTYIHVRSIDIVKGLHIYNATYTCVNCISAPYIVQVCVFSLSASSTLSIDHDNCLATPAPVESPRPPFLLIVARFGGCLSRLVASRIVESQRVVGQRGRPRQHRPWHAF